MRRRYRDLVVCLGLVVAFLAPRPVHAGKDLASRLDAVINSPEYRQARWGILVVDARTGKPLYQHNADQAFTPASTIKLYYAAAALAALGTDYQFETPVYRRGRVADGSLRGDLILVASGDLTLGGRTLPGGKMAFRDDDHTYANGAGAESELTDTDPLAGLKALAKQVAAAGIRQVEGDVLIDDRLFPTVRSTGTGADWLSPIVVNDNVVDVVVSPGPRPGEWARVRLRPETDYVRTESEVITVPPGGLTRVEIQSTGQESFVVRGQIALGSRPVLRVYPVQDPAAFARALFVEALRRQGVRVPAGGLQTPRSALPDRAAYAHLNRVALFTSPPFSEMLRVALKTSSNLYANSFPLLIAVKNGKRAPAEGLAQMRRTLADLGVDLEDISLATASGGTRDDRLTPRAVVQLLQVMAKRTDYPVFREALPVLGVDGTLFDMVSGESPARGKVQGKTGTYYIPARGARPGQLRVKALAGTMTTAGGRALFFALYVNDVLLPPGVDATRETRVLGRLCEVLYEDTP
jgi:D-alanyl-D-alanine carboxypeptidase/D-alanyl-D-alanine-endopeptidase (penicillin-binding protein 4)